MLDIDNKIEHISWILGHSSPRTTMDYIGVSPEDFEEVKINWN